jgi:eukaryotic-like serine/threonine-protein kinase
LGRDTQQGLLLEGRYRLVEPLGVGGFGRVWRARDEKLRVDVAIKELWLPQRNGSPEHRVSAVRAVREARNVARLRSHPNIVNLLDVLDAEEQPWIVMELVRGETLAKRIKKRTRLPVHEVAMIGKALLNALEAAHAAGIIHRDVTPENVMLADDSRVLLADFGIAKNLGDYGITPDGDVIGSCSRRWPGQ